MNKRKIFVVVGIVSVIIILVLILKTKKNGNKTEILKETVHHKATDYYADGYANRKPESQIERYYLGGTKKRKKTNEWCPVYYNFMPENGKYNIEVKLSNFIEAGGSDLINEPKKYIDENRKQTKKFQKFICDYIGGFNNTGSKNWFKYLNKNDSGIGSSIDLLVEENWNYNDYYGYYNMKMLDNLEDLNNCTTEDYSSTSRNLANEFEYICTILRNSFGIVSDKFLLISEGIVHFDEIKLKDVNIGDIGIYKDDFRGLCPGMCVGFDKDMNPIFAVCATKDRKDKIVELEEDIDHYGGTNILHVEKKGQIAFENYYKTDVPFVDKVDKKDLIIEDINKYNIQAKYRKLLKEGKWTGDDLCQRVLDERERRITLREKDGEENRKRFNINLDDYFYTNWDDRYYFANGKKTYDFETGELLDENAEIEQYMGIEDLNEMESLEINK